MSNPSKSMSVTAATLQLCAHTATSETDECLLRLYPNEAVVWERLEYLRRVGWGGVS